MDSKEERDKFAKEENWETPKEKLKTCGLDERTVATLESEEGNVGEAVVRA